MNTPHRALMALVLLATICPAFGCRKSDTSPATSSTPTKPDPKTVLVQRVDKAEFEKVIAEQRGKVVLVDFWATWCPPCVAQLPHSAELARSRAAKGLVVISCSFDEPEDESHVIAVLADKGPTTVNLLSRLGGEKSVDAFEIAGGTLPSYSLYDRSGKLVNRFSTSESQTIKPEDLDRAVDELLK
jgi:thiol-disulfide isomerase/thioredoxin